MGGKRTRASVSSRPETSTRPAFDLGQRWNETRRRWKEAQTYERKVKTAPSKMHRLNPKTSPNRPAKKPIPFMNKFVKPEKEGRGQLSTKQVKGAREKGEDLAGKHTLDVVERRRGRVHALLEVL